MKNVKLNFGRLCQQMLQMLWCQAVPKRNWSSLQKIQVLELLVTSSLGSSLDLGSPWITAILGNSCCMLALPLHLLMPVVTLGYQICPLFWFITVFFFFFFGVCSWVLILFLGKNSQVKTALALRQYHILVLHSSSPKKYACICGGLLWPQADCWVLLFFKN